MATKRTLFVDTSYLVLFKYCIFPFYLLSLHAQFNRKLFRVKALLHYA